MPLNGTSRWPLIAANEHDEREEKKGGVKRGFPTSPHYPNEQPIQPQLNLNFRSSLC